MAFGSVGKSCTVISNLIKLDCHPFGLGFYATYNVNVLLMARNFSTGFDGGRWPNQLSLTSTRGC